MRGVETRIQEIRHAVFTEVAKMAYEEGPVDKKIEALPYKIIPGETGNFRNDVFLERAIVGERLRMAMGLPYRGAAEPAPVSDGIMEADKPEGYYTPPLINVIKFACNACDEKKVHVTDGCQGCLAHPCMEVSPLLIRMPVSNVDAVQQYVPIMRLLFRNVLVQKPVV